MKDGDGESRGRPFALEDLVGECAASSDDRRGSDRLILGLGDKGGPVGERVCAMCAIGFRSAPGRCARGYAAIFNLDQKQEYRILHPAIRIVGDKAPRGRECGVNQLITTVVNPLLNSCPP